MKSKSYTPRTLSLPLSPSLFFSHKYKKKPKKKREISNMHELIWRGGNNLISFAKTRPD
jgi:hypothetical protein